MFFQVVCLLIGIFNISIIFAQRYQTLVKSEFPLDNIEQVDKNGNVFNVPLKPLPEGTYAPDPQFGLRIVKINRKPANSDRIVFEDDDKNKVETEKKHYIYFMPKYPSWKDREELYKMKDVDDNNNDNILPTKEIQQKFYEGTDKNGNILSHNKDRINNLGDIEKVLSKNEQKIGYHREVSKLKDVESSTILQGIPYGKFHMFNTKKEGKEKEDFNLDNKEFLKKEEKKIDVSTSLDFKNLKQKEKDFSNTNSEKVKGGDNANVPTRFEINSLLVNTENEQFYNSPVMDLPKTYGAGEYGFRRSLYNPIEIIKYNLLPRAFSYPVVRAIPYYPYYYFDFNQCYIFLNDVNIYCGSHVHDISRSENLIYLVPFQMTTQLEQRMPDYRVLDLKEPSVFSSKPFNEDPHGTTSHNNILGFNQLTVNNLKPFDKSNDEKLHNADVKNLTLKEPVKFKSTISSNAKKNEVNLQGSKMPTTFEDSAGREREILERFFLPRKSMISRFRELREKFFQLPKEDFHTSTNFFKCCRSTHPPTSYDVPVY